MATMAMLKKSYDKDEPTWNMKIWKRKAKRMSPAFRIMLTCNQKMRVVVNAVWVQTYSDDLFMQSQWQGY